MTAAAESLLKSGEVSALIRHGFLSQSSPPFTPPRFSPHLSSSPFSSPPPPLSSSFSSSPPPPSSSTSTPSPSTTSSISSHSFSSSSSGNRSPATPPTTLFEMMEKEKLLPRSTVAGDHTEKRFRLQERIASVLSGKRSNLGPGDVEFSVSSSDGFRFSMVVHRSVLASGSRFFAEKVGSRGGVVEICECDDVEVYLEVIAMMYCSDLRRQLCGQSAKRVLGLLKVSAAIMFDAGVAACLQHLEAIPWSESEEDEVVYTLSQLPLRDPITDVLQRVLVDPSSSSRADAIFLRLLTGILQSKDEKARRDMKALLLVLLREDNTQTDRIDISKETLYFLCHKSIASLLLSLTEASTLDETRCHDRSTVKSDIAREADNILWLLEILVSKKMADEFAILWAEQRALADIHGKVLSVFRYEISRITVRLCIALGKGEVLVSKETRFAVLRTWLDALYDDFWWMMRACRGFDRRAVEDGVSQTILTLSMEQQQVLLLRWFDRFLKKGDDCPNMKTAFEVWWRRAFVRRFIREGEAPTSSRLEIAVCDYSCEA